MAEMMATKYPLIPLSEVLTQNKEYISAPEMKMYPKLSVKLYGKGVVIDEPADGSLLKMKQHQIAKSGQVILSEIWGKKGAIGFVPPEGDGALCTSHFFLFDINHEKLEQKYLQAIFTANYLENQLNTEAKGSTGYAAVRPKHLLSAKIPLPPLAEQRRIVARIEELAEKIEEARGLRKRAIEEVEAFEKSLLDKVYNFNINKFGSSELSEVCSVITDGDHLTPTFQEKGVKFIFVSNVSSGHLHFNDCKYVSSEYFASIKTYRKPRKGDVLYSAVGATLGVPAIVASNDNFCFQRHVALIRPDQSRLLSKFIWHMLRSQTLYQKAWKGTTGSAQPTVPLRVIRALPIPVPSIEQQDCIIAYLDDLQAKVDQMKNQRQKALQELNALLPAILDKAFKGEL